VKGNNKYEVPCFADGDVFVPTEEQLALLKEGVEYAKELEEWYSNLTMEGMTEHLNSYDPESERRWTESFRFIRLGYELGEIRPARAQCLLPPVLTGGNRRSHNPQALTERNKNLQ